MQTLEEITECFNQARAFYKDGEKSNNKTYEFAALPGVDYAKELKKWGDRDENAALSDLMMKENPLRGKGSYEQVGKNIRDTGAKYGNCVEMNCLASFLIRNRFPGASMWSVSIKIPGDHFFIVVNEIPTGKTVRDLAQTPSAKPLIVVDVWMNICCHASNYNQLGIAKLNKWGTEGKRITSWITGTKTIFVPSSAAYVSGFSNSQLWFWPTNLV